MEQARFNFLLIMFVIVSFAAIAAVAYAAYKEKETRAAHQRAFEFKQMYLGEVERNKKLASERSILKLYIKSLTDFKVLPEKGVWRR